MSQVSTPQTLDLLPRVSLDNASEEFSNQEFFEAYPDLVRASAYTKRYLAAAGIVRRQPVQSSTLSYLYLARDFAAEEVCSILDYAKRNIRPWMVALLIINRSPALARDRYPITQYPEGVTEFPHGFNETPAENIFWIGGHMLRMSWDVERWHIYMDSEFSNDNPFRAHNRIFFLA